MEDLRALSNEEMECVFGGGLVEDIGYLAHAAVDKCCEAYEFVKGKVGEAYDWVRGLF